MSENKTALVIIDVVNGCCHEECESVDDGITFKKIRKMVPRLERFIENYRESINKNVVFVNLTPWTKDFLPANIQRLYENPDVCYYGEGGFEEGFYKVAPTKSDKIITKNTYDVFANSEFEKLLRKLDVDTIAVSGVFTDGCVLSTIISGFSKGYNFIVLKDLVETTDLQVRQRLAKDLLSYTIPMQYGRVMLSSEFLKEQQK